MTRYLLLLCILLLPGCSETLDTRTLRPGQNGTDRPYRITNSFMTNERFEPQPHLEYEEVGVASWYGPGFHGKKTSTGEVYNQHAFTAAHRTLPLPAIVRITNLENGKSLVVKVNDRGPFTGDQRIIDVTLAGAKQLGFHNKGTAKVKVETLVSESVVYNEKKIFVGEAAHLASHAPSPVVAASKEPRFGKPSAKPIKLATVSKNMMTSPQKKLKESTKKVEKS